MNFIIDQFAKYRGLIQANEASSLGMSVKVSSKQFDFWLCPYAESAHARTVDRDKEFWSSYVDATGSSEPNGSERYIDNPAHLLARKIRAQSTLNINSIFALIIEVTNDFYLNSTHKIWDL